MRLTMNRKSYYSFLKPEEIERQYQVEGAAEGAEILVYTTTKGTPGAMGWTSKAAKKPAFNFHFNSQEFRDTYIKEREESWIQREKDKVARREERKAAGHPLKVGDILYSSWGYDQTNIDFYQVTELRGTKQVVIQAIGAGVVRSSETADYLKALPGHFLEDSKPMVKVPSQDGSINLNSYSNAHPWSGEPKYQTGWGYGH